MARKVSSLQLCFSRVSPTNLLAIVLGMAVMVLASGQASANSRVENELHLRLVDETAPPGGVARIFLELTEPKPISGGQIEFSSSYADSSLGFISKVGLFSQTADVDGQVTFGTDQVVIQFQSPGASFGTDPDLPIVVVEVPVSPTAAPGETVQLTLNLTNCHFLDPDGKSYLKKLTPGTFRVGGVSINELVPGSGILRAGSTLAVKGVGFQPGVKIDIQDVKVVSTRFVSSQQVDLTVGTDFQIENTRIRLRNPDGSEEIFYAATFSALVSETAAAVSDSTVTGVLASPASFPAGELTQLFLPHFVSGANWLTQISLVNFSNQAADVTLHLLGEAGSLLGRTGSNPARTFIPGRSRIILRVDEAFGLLGPKLVKGSVIVQSRVRLLGSATIGELSPRMVATTVPLLERPFSGATFAQILHGPLGSRNFFTAFAFQNPNPFKVSISIEVFSGSGEFKGRSGVTLKPGGHTSMTLSELIPGLEPLLGGSVRVVSSLPIAMLELIGSDDLDFLTGVVPTTVH